MLRQEHSRVAVLAPAVVGQIAAGEVIERPASVARELVDNALDAGATQVEVVVEKGGRQRIEVRDDGCGIASGDLPLALARHATSKLRALEDLFALDTFGFRGEGLSSIAAVSKLSILSRAAGEVAAHRLRATGGEVSPAEPAARQQGTTVEVLDLFFNTPARLKFLKSTPTESAHVHEVVMRAALAAPAVRFTLRAEGRVVLELPAARTRLERVRALWGKNATALSARRSAGPLTVEAFLSPLDDNRSNARALQVLVNQRPVRDRLVVQAVSRACGQRLPARRYPRAVIFVECDPALLDINVHPQKHEVRFADPAAVFSLVSLAVAAALGEAAPPAADLKSSPPRGQQPAPARVYRLGAEGRGEAESYVHHQRRLAAAAKRFWGDQSLGAAEERVDYGLGAAFARALPLGDTEGERPRLLGRSGAGVLVCEHEDALLLVSESAARRALAKRELRASTAARQQLQSPLVFAPRSPQLWRRHAVDLTELGFEIEAFGGGDFVLRALPGALNSAETALRALLEQIDECLGRADADDAVLDLLAGEASRDEGACSAEELVERLGSELVARAQRVGLEGARGATQRAAVEVLALRLDKGGIAAFLEPGDG